MPEMQTGTHRFSKYMSHMTEALESRCSQAFVSLEARDPSSNTSHSLLSYLDSLPLNSRLIITALPGGGKTYTVTQHAYNLLRHGRLALPVNLRSYSTSISDLLSVTIKRLEESISVLDFLYGSADYFPTLLLDGVDEVAPSLRIAAVSDIVALAAKVTNCTIILTSRPDMPLPNVGWRHLEILPLTHAQVRQYLRQNVPPDPLEDVLHELQERPDLEEHIKSPLLLCLLAEFIKTKGRPPFISESPFDTQEIFLKSLLTNPDERTLAECLAFHMVKNAASEITLEQLKEVASINNIDLSTMSRILARPIYHTANARFSFVHQSLLLHLCTSYLLRSVGLQEISEIIGDIPVNDLGDGVLKLFVATLTQEQLRRAGLAGFSPYVIRRLILLASEEKGVRMIDMIRANDYHREAEEISVSAFVESVSATDEALKSSRRDIIVMSLHGANTRGIWQHELAPVLAQETDGVRYLYHPWDYGYLLLRILDPTMRKRVIRRFHEWFLRVLAPVDRSKTDVCVIAHSFGSYVFGKAMLRFPDLEADRVILVGSVLKRSYPWSCVGHRLALVVNQVACADKVVHCAQYVPGFGNSGEKGFIDAPAFVREEKYIFSEHSDLFGRKHMSENWIPILQQSVRVQRER